jgi:drug/metabolite transporter (DMT)-like permease
VAKHLVSSYPVLQVVWGRFLFHVILAALILGPRFAILARSANLPLQIVRSILLLATTVLFFSGVRLLPLADASAIMFTSPILLSILAIPILGEKVGPYRWAAICIAFLGALVVVRPGTGVMGVGALFLLASSFCNAFYQIITRQLRGTDDARTTLLYTGLAGAVGTSLAVPLVWTPIALGDWPLFVALGVFGCLGHFTLIKAFQSAPATVVAPFSYASLIWAILFGFFVFGDLPDVWTLAGATIIAAGGLYILHREQVRKAEQTARKQLLPADVKETAK